MINILIGIVLLALNAGVAIIGESGLTWWTVVGTTSGGIMVGLGIGPES